MARRARTNYHEHIRSLPSRTSLSTNAWQLFSHQHVDDPPPAEHRAHGDAAGPAVANPSNERRAFAERMRSHCRQPSVDLVRGSDHDDLAFVGEIKRIQPEDFTERLDLLADRRGGLFDLDRNLRRIGDLVQYRRQPTTRRISYEANPRSRRQQHLDQSMQTGAIAFNQGVERHVAPRTKDGRAMIAEQTVDQHHVSRPRDIYP